MAIELKEPQDCECPSEHREAVQLDDVTEPAGTPIKASRQTDIAIICVICGDVAVVAAKVPEPADGGVRP